MKHNLAVKITARTFAGYLAKDLITVCVIASVTACGGGGNQTSSGGNTGGGGTNAVSKAWGTPVLLENVDGIANGPAVAADRVNNGWQDGTVIAVWSQFDGSQYSIFASRYDSGWSAPVVIENENSGGFAGKAYGPRIAMGDQGQALVAWSYYDGSSYSIWANRYNFGDPAGNLGIMSWQTEQQISLIGSGNANSPQVALDGDGFRAFTVWSQYQFGSNQSNYRGTQKQYDFVDCLYTVTTWQNCVFDPNNYGWSGASLLDLTDIGDASEQQIAAWGAHNAVAVWTQNISGIGNQIWANVAGNGTWGSAQRINTGSTNGAGGPVVAVDGNGNALAVWVEFVGTRTTLFASRYSSNTSSWSAPLQIDDPNGSNASAVDPAHHVVAMDATGNAFLVWRQANADSSETNIYARRCSGGLPSSCEAPVLLEHATGYADLPALTLAPGGDAVAVWKQDDNGARRIYANHYSAANGSWDTDSSLVGGADGTWNEGPQIAIDGSGNATVVWTEYVAGKYNIYANRYE